MKPKERKLKSQSSLKPKKQKEREGKKKKKKSSVRLLKHNGTHYWNVEDFYQSRSTEAKYAFISKWEQLPYKFLHR